MIQIPVNYTKRVGTSSVTGNKAVAVALGLRMIRLVVEYRAQSLLSPQKFDLPQHRTKTNSIEDA